MRRARRQKNEPMTGYIVTWDVDSRDRTQCVRLRRFVYGYTGTWHRRSYRYPGFVEREGVRYLGQSVLFVTAVRLEELRKFLRSNGVAYVIVQAWIGARLAG
ncbi:MAG: hypothetical protein HY557_04800 [Euryarchaeota archaeon]|nr:hypothetical protein [Euryarchaeota archaeon]